MTSEGFQQLAQLARDGDREAMDRVLDMLRPYLHDIAHTYADPARPAASTTDLVQESCLQAWNHIGKFRGGENDEATFAMFRAWIGQIVRRAGLGARRSLAAKKRNPGKRPIRLDARGPEGETTAAGAGDVPGRGPTPSSIVRGTEEGDRVREALTELPDELGAAIVRLHYFDELPLSEIAERLDLDYDHVRHRFRTAMRALEKHLKGPA